MRSMISEILAALLVLGCYANAELCAFEGEQCTQNDPVGCTLRATCQNGTEISIGEEGECKQCQKLCAFEGGQCTQNDPVGCTLRATCQNGTEISIGEEGECKQCQKPCSEKIYIQYSSLNDNTPATGWYTYSKKKNHFVRTVDIYTYFLRKKDNKWILTEVKDPSFMQREITKRIELSYKNDKRTLISLDNFGFDENERKNLNIFIAPEGSVQRGFDYEEKLVIFCPGKCLCKKFNVKNHAPGYCFRGQYTRNDSTKETEQPKQEYVADNSPLSNVKEKKHASDSRSKRFAGFAGFVPNSEQSVNSKPNKDSTTNDDEPINDQVLNSSKEFGNILPLSVRSTYGKPRKYSPTYNNEPINDQLLRSSKTLNRADSNNNTGTKGESKNEEINPNDWYARNEEENQNWKEESYIFTGETYGDKPFEFIFDKEYQVWFLGKLGDDIAAVIPEASPCPELIQKQSWYAIDEQFKLKKGKEPLERVSIECIERG